MNPAAAALPGFFLESGRFSPPFSAKKTFFLENRPPEPIIKLGAFLPKELDIITRLGKIGKLFKIRKDLRKGIEPDRFRFAESGRYRFCYPF
ncbi:MAG: hypothetical protein IJG60_08715 [Thermoguttaceae bacterium]|nr:hypothetical protein [Thermoguttaceae bacterium]